MPYLPRYQIIDDQAYFHVTWKCHNKDWLLKEDWAKQIYYNLLLKYKDKYGVVIHAYTFMDNHPHIIGKLRTKEEFSQFFRIVNCLFAKRVNQHLQRCGQVVMDRFKSPKIETDKHMLRAMVYVDLNQYRAKKVQHPKDNTFSSFVHYAFGIEDPLISDSPSYIDLAPDQISRQLAYQAMVADLLTNSDDFNISHTYFIGNPDWVINKYRELRDVMRETMKTKSHEAIAAAG